MRIIRSSQKEYSPANHEDPKKPGVWRKILAFQDDFFEGRVRMINWARLPVSSSFRAHYHEDMQEIFIMVRGKAEVRVGDHIDHLAVGDTLMVDPGEVHSMTNCGSEEVEYVVVGICGTRNGKTVVV